MVNDGLRRLGPSDEDGPFYLQGNEVRRRHAFKALLSHFRSHQPSQGARCILPADVVDLVGVDWVEALRNPSHASPMLTEMS